MANNKNYVAIDLGATSGRVILASIADGQVQMKEVHRFPNGVVGYGGHSYWNLMALYQEVLHGLKTIARQGIRPVSIGIDTWGCDFVVADGDGNFPANPRAYRDTAWAEWQEQFTQKVMSKQRLYELTGIQLMPFNSVFQLYALMQTEHERMERARQILFIPDALSYLLTGEAVCEYTVASTAEILNPRTRDLEPEILNALGLPRSKFGRLVQPGTRIGRLTPEIQQLTGLTDVPVVAVAGHDTASAVAAVPARDEHFAYLSSGTWSLMGIESRTPIINSLSYERNFTNEGGIEGTTRFLKNICGMWIYERCRQEWPAEVQAMSHQQLQDEARKVAFPSRINPDDPMFANPKSMLEAICSYCRQTGQPVPTTVAEYCHCIFHSLAERYKTIFGWLQEQADFHIDTLHIIGGGSKNSYLNQLTANALGIRVLAGPTEGTALGNIMLQAKAEGEVSDIWQTRRIIANSINMTEFNPLNS